MTAEKRRAAIRAWKKAHPEKVSASKRAWRQKNLERAREYDRARYVAKPPRPKAHPGMTYYQANRSAQLEAARLAYQSNPDKFRQAARSWQQSNPDKVRVIRNRRRALEANALGSHTAEEWIAICKRQGDKCAHCSTNTTLTRDHIVPLDKGGTDYAFNIQALCRPCNSRKGVRIPDDIHYSLFDRAEL